MSRLTKKQGDLYYPNNENDIFPDDGSNAIRLLQVIGQYEDLEEELGIDLITLFKALKDGIIVIDDNYECHGLSKYRGQEIDLNIFLKRLEIKFVGCWNLSDYGKTWSLSRYDLEEQDDE